MMASSDTESSGPMEPLANYLAKGQRTYQQWLDRVTPFVLYRWLGTAGLLSLFMLRIVFAEGWYIDAQAIYLLNLLLAFLQPKFDPSLQDDLLADEIEEGGEESQSPLPSSRDDEFRPFVRRLPEWQFWLSATRATLVAIVCTFFEMFDVPVYWPILVVYWFVLFALTMRRQIQHMIKYKYIPFDFGRKARYSASARR
ncbi:retrieval of early ER protein Rer1 [Trametes versicolor FP-101664 SS1]|uniref:retrieval of early ER protein Rer1 n=1 Tax=Trametes versicolor (strain FP-101664) TaxID=717944 RepID=UPI0004622F28|nr:retrieval of early ER protein Rer1 [Trametes versicolor FP-101664 SS1]EIW54456.1 retrieval of early ER protein Rer1 [Trametes versicolor FP-101664 SS1]